MMEQVYRTTQEATARLSSGEFYSGLFSATAAGFLGGMAFYCACRKSKEEESDIGE